MMALAIRPARADDLHDVWPLARDFAISFRPRQHEFQQVFLNLLEAPQALLLVATMDEALVGYLLAHSHETFLANGPVAWGEEVMVDESRRRLGAGRALIAEAERWAVRHGCAYVAIASRRAGPFSLALGYDNSAMFYRKTLWRYGES